MSKSKANESKLIGEALALQQRLIELETRKIELMRQLSSALAIRGLWPEAFKLGGTVSSYWKLSDDGFCLVLVRKADDERKEIPIENIPPELAPSLKAVERYRRDFPRAKNLAKFIKLYRAGLALQS